MVPEALATDGRISEAALRAHIALSRRAGRDRVAIVAQKTLGDVFGVGRSTAQRWLNELEVAGYIVRTQRIRKRGGWAACEYLVAPFPGSSSDAHDARSAVGIDAESEAHGSRLDVGDTMPKATHADEQTDAHVPARDWAHSDLRVQTSSSSDQREAAASSPNGSPLLLHPFDLAKDDPRIEAELGAWQDLTRNLAYSDEDAALILARAHVRGIKPLRIRRRLEELTRAA